MEQFKASFLLFAFGWLFLGAAYPVSAQQSVLSSQTSRDPSEIISIFDLDDDNRISQAELRYGLITTFVKIDSNKDGMLQPTEIPGVSADSFLDADKDTDNKLSVHEYSDAEFMQFEAHDINSDGYISLDELSDSLHE